MKGISLISSVITMVSLLGLPLAGCGSSTQAANASVSQNSSGYPKMVIKFSYVTANDTPKGQGALKFKQVVESESGGNIKVELFPNGQLYGDKDEVGALQADNVQIIAPATAKLAGFDKSFGLYDLPFLFKNNDTLYKFEDGPGGKLLLNKLQSNNMEGLAFWPDGFKHITNNKRPITQPSDLKGLKIRTHGGNIIGAVYAQMGASSTKLAFNDTYQALQLGTVDGEENSLVNIKTQKYEEVQKYLTLTGHARSEYAVIANKKWWDGLNSKTQALIQKAMQEATQVSRDDVVKLEQQALSSIKQDGKMQVTELTDAQRQAFVDFLKPVYDKYSKEIDPAILKAIRDAGN